MGNKIVEWMSAMSTSSLEVMPDHFITGRNNNAEEVNPCDDKSHTRKTS
ncbi:MAG: hypothetical protein PHF87_10810 [Desulfotomaculaceae bacterium]|nr:hypothetical protein [Desulfotomaculaceae bacterium]